MPPDHQPTAQEVNAIWDSIARWWDEQIGEGNEFQRLLIMPATDRLLEPKPGQRILDVACGNGNYARRLGVIGASVVAIDASAQFIARARERTTPEHGDIEYRQIDATDESALSRLGERSFDSAVCSMAMMDLPMIDPLLDAMRRVLKPHGRFVFSLPHPCFNSTNVRMTAEMDEGDDGRLRQRFGVTISEYITSKAKPSTGILHQPTPHYLFHRPLGEIFRACFAAGLVVDGLEEPTYPISLSRRVNTFSWQKRPEIPPAIVVRLRHG